MSTQFNCQKHLYFKLFKQLYITNQFTAVSMLKTVQFQTIQFSISTQFKFLSQFTFLFQAIQFSQAVLIQLIQFSISTDFIYTQLNIKTVLC